MTGLSGSTAAAVPGWDHPWGTTNFQIWANNATELSNGVVAGFGSSVTLIDNLAPTTFVDGNSPGYVRTGNTETTGSTAFLLNGSNNYIGFRFLNETTGAINYGWPSFLLSAQTAPHPRRVCLR